MCTQYLSLLHLHLPVKDEAIEGNWTEMVKEFDQMNLHELLLRGIYNLGFERPSAIQQRAIKPCILGEHPFDFETNARHFPCRT